MPLVRQRVVGAGAGRRGGELSDPAGAIRPAVEAALALAREGLAADPVVPPPQALRRYLGFSKLSPGALRAIARVVERDEAFRERVAAFADEDSVGRAGWLWLRRPEGWADELAAIEAESAARAEEARRERDERSAVKKLAVVQAAAAQASTDAEERAREVETLRAEMARRRAQEADLRARLAAAETEAERLAAARSEVVRNLKEVEARLVERSTELNVAKARIRELEEAGGPGSDCPGGAPPDAPVREQGREITRGPPRDAPVRTTDREARGGLPRDAPVPRTDREARGGLPRDAPVPRTDREARGGLPRDALGRELARAAAGAASLAESLAALATLLEPAGAGEPDVGEPDTSETDVGETDDAGETDTGEPDTSETAVGSDEPGERGAANDEPGGTGGTGARSAESGAPGAPGARSGTGAGTPAGGGQPVGSAPGSGAVSARAEALPGGRPAALVPPRRVPLRLPGGVFDDSVEAAEHLLRVAGVVLVVDGYNVTMEGWPALAAAEQRRRLVAVLVELAARTATDIEIVFDGAEVAAVPVPALARSLVHVRFSPPGVEADDVVLDLVGQLPPVRPVVVASSDNRVRVGARSLGANVVHARQLLDALRR